eukprot:EG_transcript_27481
MPLGSISLAFGFAAAVLIGFVMMLTQTSKLNASLTPSEMAQSRCHPGPCREMSASATKATMTRVGDQRAPMPLYAMNYVRYGAAWMAEKMTSIAPPDALPMPTYGWSLYFLYVAACAVLPIAGLLVWQGFQSCVDCFERRLDPGEDAASPEAAPPDSQALQYGT